MALTMPSPIAVDAGLRRREEGAGIDVEAQVVERPHELRPAAVTKRLPEAGLARRVAAVRPVEADPELVVAQPRRLLLSGDDAAHQRLAGAVVRAVRGVRRHAQ